jgi:hypothetical protein
MSFTRELQQKGSLRKVLRYQEVAWKFRYRRSDADGRRREKVQTLDSSGYAAEFEVRKAMESQMSAHRRHAPRTDGFDVRGPGHQVPE